MRANVIASLVIKGALVLLTPFGFVTLVIAVAADMGTSLLVTLNAMRLLGRRPDRAAPAARPGRPPTATCADGCCSARAEHRNE